MSVDLNCSLIFFSNSKINLKGRNINGHLTWYLFNTEEN